MDINHDFKNFIDMEKTGAASYASGVELGSDGKELKTAQGNLLKAVDKLAITGAIFMLTITMGIKSAHLWLDSPILSFMAVIIAFVSLLIALAATFIWYLITGMSGPMSYIADALPAGGVLFKASVCLFPITIIGLVIALRTYSRIYVPKTIAHVLLIVCVGLITMSAYVLGKY